MRVMLLVLVQVGSSVCGLRRTERSIWFRGSECQHLEWLEIPQDVIVSVGVTTTRRRQNITSGWSNRMSERQGVASTILLVLVVTSAVAVAVATVKREFFEAPLMGPAGGAREPTVVEDWQEFSTIGHRTGPLHAAVTVLEFADFECPACRRLATGGLAGVKAEVGTDVAVVFRHWPLTYHRFRSPPYPVDRS